VLAARDSQRATFVILFVNPITKGEVPTACCYTLINVQTANLGALHKLPIVFESKKRC
jgi:hypothetical protein